MNLQTMDEMINAEDIREARARMKAIVNHTPLNLNMRLSEKYDSNIYLK